MPIPVLASVVSKQTKKGKDKPSANKNPELDQIEEEAREESHEGDQKKREAPGKATRLQEITSEVSELKDAVKAMMEVQKEQAEILRK